MCVEDNHKLLEVKNLVKYFPVYGGIFSRIVANVKAVDDISFSVNRGETFGIVGESGCGKSTAGRTILRLIEPTSGDVYYGGQEVFRLNKKQLRKIRQNMQIIFQDPYASLNPRMSVGALISEPLKIHTNLKQKQIKEKVEEALEIVGLNPYHYAKYPHEFSGGQRQRIGIARALIMNPELIICDEPVSALDVSIQSQILNLLSDLQDKYDLTYVFVSHDLSVVKHICDRICVMYLGKIMEIAKADDLYKDTKHPYTKALLSAIPQPDPMREIKRVHLQGEVPSPLNPPSGCRFHPRCPYSQSICSLREPEFKDYGNNHYTACHFPL